MTKTIQMHQVFTQMYMYKAGHSHFNIYWHVSLKYTKTKLWYLSSWQIFERRL
jgi:hypothetical protein